MAGCCTPCRRAKGCIRSFTVEVFRHSPTERSVPFVSMTLRTAGSGETVEDKVNRLIDKAAVCSSMSGHSILEACRLSKERFPILRQKSGEISASHPGRFGPIIALRLDTAPFLFGTWDRTLHQGASGKYPVPLQSTLTPAMWQSAAGERCDTSALTRPASSARTSSVTPVFIAFPCAKTVRVTAFPKSRNRTKTLPIIILGIFLRLITDRPSRTSTSHLDISWLRSFPAPIVSRAENGVSPQQWVYFDVCSHADGSCPAFGSRSRMRTTSAKVLGLKWVSSSVIAPFRWPVSSRTLLSATFPILSVALKKSCHLRNVRLRRSCSSRLLAIPASAC